MYKIGDVIHGKITGIQPYGAFVSLSNETQGLVHISEVKHGYIKNISEVLTVGDDVTVQVIDYDEYTKKISLSLRVLDEAVVYHHYNKKKYFTNKNKKIGFASLGKELPKWIDQAMDELLPE